MSFLRNSWYVAAWDRELSRSPLARTFLNEAVVLYRKEDGAAVASRRVAVESAASGKVKDQ